jgi:hypothetical protein
VESEERVSVKEDIHMLSEMFEDAIVGDAATWRREESIQRENGTSRMMNVVTDWSDPSDQNHHYVCFLIDRGGRVCVSVSGSCGTAADSPMECLPGAPPTAPTKSTVGVHDRVWS